MQRHNLNKVLMQLYWNNTSAWMLSYKFAAYFQRNFLYEHAVKTAPVGNSEANNQPVDNK